MQIYLMFIVVSQKPTERTLFRTKRRLNREIALKTTNKTKMYRKIPKRQATVRRQVGTFEKYFIFFSILSLSKFKSLSLYSFVPLFHVSKVVLFNSAQVNQNFFFSFYCLSADAPSTNATTIIIIITISAQQKYQEPIVRKKVHATLQQKYGPKLSLYVFWKDSDCCFLRLASHFGLCHLS